MMHPHTRLGFIDNILGFGVFATEFIPKGTVTWARDSLDQVVPAAHVAAMDENRREAFLTYTYRDSLGAYVLLWDHGRYMNHDFDANTATTPYGIELAVRDIAPGEELTCDYRTLNLDFPLESLREGPDMGRQVKLDDLLSVYRDADRKVADAFRHFGRVEQPLAHLIASGYREKIARIVQGTEPPDSILTTFYDRSK